MKINYLILFILTIFLIIFLQQFSNIFHCCNLYNTNGSPAAKVIAVLPCVFTTKSSNHENKRPAKYFFVYTHQKSRRKDAHKRGQISKAKLKCWKLFAKCYCNRCEPEQNQTKNQTPAVYKSNTMELELSLAE